MSRRKRSSSAKSAPRRKTSPALLLMLLVIIAGIAFHLGRQAWGAYQLRAARQAMLVRDFENAREHAAKALRIWPRDVETLLAAAQAARRAGRLEEAFTHLKAAEKEQAPEEAVQGEQQLLRLQAGDLREADRLLRNCTQHVDNEQVPLVLEALIVGGLKSLDVARASQALELWDKTCSDPASRVQADAWRGEIAIRTGNVEAATNSYRRAVEAAPNNDPLRLRLAELLLRYSPQESLTHLQTLQARRPLDRDVQFILARCRRSLGEPERANQLLKELVKTAASPEVWLEYGQSFLDLQHPEQAETQLRKAHELAPERRDVNLALARCLQLLGRDPEAESFRKKVADIDAALADKTKQLLEKGKVEDATP